MSKERGVFNGLAKAVRISLPYFNWHVFYVDIKQKHNRAT